MPKIFPISRYDQMVKETVDKIVELGVKKGGEYAGDVDRLANFRRNGDAAGVPMELIWRIYVSKHWDAIMQYEQDLRTGKTRPRMEGLDGRVDDIIVYMLLFKAMLLERAEDTSYKPSGEEARAGAEGTYERHRDPPLTPEEEWERIKGKVWGQPDDIVEGLIRTLTNPSATPGERLSAADMLGAKTGLFGVFKPFSADPKFNERLKAAIKSLDEMPRNVMSPEEQMDTIDKLFASEGPARKDEPTNNIPDLSFGQALNWLKLGKRVARRGWNGKGMWLFLIEPRGKAIIGVEDYPQLPWIGMKTADDKFVPWLANQTDLLAIDWGVLE